MTTTEPTGRPGVRSAIQLIFLAICLAAAVALLIAHSEAIFEALQRLDPAAVILALGAAAGHVVISYWAWRILTPRGPTRLSASQARRLFFLSQAGKYLPGGIWQFVAAGELGRDLGMQRRESIASFVFALIAAIAAGAALALARLADQLTVSGYDPVWFGLALIPLVVLLFPPVSRLLGKVARLDELPKRSALFLSALLALGTWGFGGAMLAALAGGLGFDASLSSVLLYAAYYAAAWIAGFLILIAPAGIGAREGVLVALLVFHMPVAEAAITALLARILVILVDLGAAGLVLGLSRSPASQ